MVDKAEDFAVNNLHYQIKITNPNYAKRLAAPSLLKTQEWDEVKEDMELYTRDLRLGNIPRAQYERALKWLSIAGDCMSEGMPNPAKSALRRVADIVELSQSRGGFLRNMLNTVIRRDTVSQSLSEDKGGLFSRRKSGGGNND